jgi:hypothetical protein
MSAGASRTDRKRVRALFRRPQPTLNDKTTVGTRWRALELDQARICRLEATGVEIELAQVIVEVDVEPLAACRARLGDRDGNELGSDSLPGGSGSHHRVEDEGVYSSIPRDVDEADEPGAVARADPAQTVLLGLSLPVVFEGAVPERLGV